MELDNNNISKISVFIEKAWSLSHIYMSNNSLMEIPNQLLKLNLITLFLDGNKLSTISNLIGQAVNLRYLKLHNNRNISHVPESIGKLLRLHDIDLRIKAIEDFRHKSESIQLISANKRVNNILNKSIPHGNYINVTHFVSDKEELLFQAVQKIKPEIDEKIKLRSYSDALETLLSLYLPLDDFFENVMVNADDESVRNNRLALMTEIQELFLKVADISQMAT